MNSGTLFTGALMLATLYAPAGTMVEIDKALEKKMVKAEVTCNGGLSVSYKLNNQTKEALDIIVPAGWRMNSVKEEYQDILVTREQVLALKPREQKTVMIKGYCCEATHSGPVKGAKYEPGKLAEPHLVLLAKYLNAQHSDENTEQYAVWAISDKRPMANITGANDSLTTLLRNFVAVLKDEPIPWYTLQKRVRINNYGAINEHPVNLKATVNYAVDKTCYAYLYVLDELGNKVGAITGQ
ncbi:MAG: hypothetical protein ACXVDL_15820, partial [Bacteroidia bacterium]